MVHFESGNFGRVRQTASFTDAHALLQEPPLHRIARQRECCSEMFAGDLVPPTSKFKLAERGMIEGITSETIRIDDQRNFLKASF
jgi:hypothetical protein